MPLFSRLLVAASLVLAAAACSGPAETAAGEADLSSAALVVHGTIQPQSFVHDTVSDATPQIAWSFTGTAGEIVAPDVWPTAQNGLHPTLKLLGPSVSGKRPTLAVGAQRGSNPAHLAIDGFKLPRNGSYLVLVGEAAAGQGGQFTLRFWTSTSHAPRIESEQLDLSLQTSAAVKQLLAQHGSAASAAAWTDADVDGALAVIAGETAKQIALSDVEQLLLALIDARTDGGATDAQVLRAKQAALTIIGKRANFSRWIAQHQAFALFWLGRFNSLLFSAREVPATETGAAVSAVTDQIAGLVASWPGAQEDADQHHVLELSLGGTVYGYVADWAAAQNDTDGTQIFEWYSTDYFDAAGNWLGETSAGATEDDEG